MLNDRPILKDRLQALTVFTGIAIGAVSGFEMVIGGGFDPLTPGREIERVERANFSPYLDVAVRSYEQDSYALPIGYFETTMNVAASDVSGDDLEGLDTNWEPSGLRQEEDVAADIERLMRESETGFGSDGDIVAPEDAPVTYEDAPVIYEDAPPSDEVSAFEEVDLDSGSKEVSVSDIATPS